jgi:hypothetical protein
MSPPTWAELDPAKNTNLPLYAALFLASLGGLARTPAILPKQRDRILLLTEDGEAWLCDATSGALEGPLALGSSPVAGPIQGTDGVRARLRDGRTILWVDALAPDTSASTTGDENAPEASDPAAGNGAMVALRRTASGALSLKSPWTGWTVEVGDKACILRARDDDKPSITVRREGMWTFVAWEAPRAQLSRGRLWVADGLGLRSYLP